MKVLIVDDDALVTNGIQTILEGEASRRQEDLKVCEVGHNGLEALELYQEKKPDICLMDIRMPEMDGIQAGQVMLKKDPSARIIYLTTFLEDEYIVRALKMGAKGYIVKTSFASIYPALQAVMNGQRVFGDEIVDRIPDLMKKEAGPIEGLSESENALVYWVAQGKSNAEIGAILHFSEGTITNYLSSILAKLGLRNRTELAIYYYKSQA